MEENEARTYFNNYKLVYNKGQQREKLNSRYQL